MISTFKPAGRLAVAAFLVLLIALGCFTFTRAADQSAPAAQLSDAPLRLAIDKDGALRVGDSANPVTLDQFKSLLRSELKKDPNRILSLTIHADREAPFGNLIKVLDAAKEANVRDISLFTGKAFGTGAVGSLGTSHINSGVKLISDPDETSKQLNLLNEKLRHKADLLNALRLELGVPSDVVDGTPPPQSDPETMRHMKELLIDSEVKLAGQENLLSELRKLKTEALPQVLPTVVPDQILNTLLQDKNTAESLRARQKVGLGDNNPEVQSTEALIVKLNSQIDVRVKGIMQGIETQITSSHAQVDNIQKKMDETREHDLESVQKYQPYIKARQELAETQRALDNINDALMKYPRGSPVLQDLIRKALENK